MADSALLQRLLPHLNEVQTSSRPMEELVEPLRREMEAFGLEEGLENMALDNSSSSSNNNDALAVLRHILHCSLSAIDANEYKQGSDRLLELTAALAAKSLPMAEALASDDVIPWSRRPNDTLRALACRWIGHLFAGLLKTGSKSDDLLDRLSQALLPRFTDKSQAVRQAAIQAAGQALSDTSQDDPDLRQALSWSLQHDPSVTNRWWALQVLPIHGQTVDAVAARVRDLKPKVRIAALEALHGSFAELTADDCADLVLAGWTERCVFPVWSRSFVVQYLTHSDSCADTKEATLSLICKDWMKACGFNPIRLLEKLDVAVHEDECDIVVRALLDANERREQVLEELSPPEIRAFADGIDAASKTIVDQDECAQVFWARAVCQHSKVTDRDAIVSKIAPDLGALCDLVENYTNEIMQAIANDDEEKADDWTTTTVQLIRLMTLVDLEEGSRRHLLRVLKRMLSTVTTPEDLVEVCVQALQQVSDGDFLESVDEIVKELVRLSQVLKDEGLELNHSVRILGILAVVFEVLPMDYWGEIPDFSVHITAGLEHESDLIREAAVGCLGKYGLFSATNAKAHEDRMLSIASDTNETEEIRSQAMLALSDWSMLFEMNLPDFVEQVTTWMARSKSLGMICIASEIASKLLFAGKLRNRSWLASLVALFFDPRLEDDEFDGSDIGSPVRLQQHLSLFFPAFCLLGSSSRDDILGCIGDLLEQTLCAPKKKSRSKPAAVVKMMQYVCSTVEMASAPTPAEGEEEQEPPKAVFWAVVGHQVAAFLVKEHDSLTATQLRAFCKFLGSLEIDLHKEDNRALGSLKEHIDMLVSTITDNNAMKSLEPLVEVLENVEEAADNESETSHDSIVAQMEGIAIDGSPAAKENSFASPTATPMDKAPETSSRKGLQVRNI